MGLSLTLYIFVYEGIALPPISKKLTVSRKKAKQKSK